MISTIIRLMIKIVFTYIRRAYYKRRVNKVKLKVEKSKKISEDQRAKSDKAYTNFLDSYNEYLITRGELRQRIEEVRGNGKGTAKDNKDSGSSD